MSSDERTRIVTPEQLAEGYYYGDPTVIGGMHRGDYSVIARLRDGNYLVRDPRPPREDARGEAK